MILFAGSYTGFVGPGLSGVGKGIYCFNFNNETGDLKLLNIEENVNTSFLAISKNKKYLYSFQEVAEDRKPKLLAYKINTDYSLTLLNEQPISGGLPCHLSLINNDEGIVVACYETGSIHVFSIEENGFLKTNPQVIQHVGKSVNTERQEGPHTHMAALYNNQVFVPDLGIDSVAVYDVIKENTEIQFSENYRIEIPLGSGPRHVEFHPNGKFAFLMNELTSEISLLKLKEDKFEVYDTINSLPKSYTGKPSGAAIKISGCGNFLYCSNRGSETITIFEFNEEEESLIIVGFQDVLGETPRDFTLSTCGNWLIVGNQDSNSVVVFKINRESGLLTKISSNKEASSVVCLKWL